MAYVALGQAGPRWSRPRTPPFRRPPRPGSDSPDGHADLRKKLRSIHQWVPGSGPSSPDAPIDWRAVAARMRGQRMPRAAKRILAKAELGQALSAYEEEYLQGFFKKIFKPFKKILAPIYRPIVAIVKKYAAPLVSMIPGVGPVAGAAVAMAQRMRADAKAQAAAQAAMQQAPSWGSMTPAEQAAMLNAMAAGAVPNIPVPKDVWDAYTRAIQTAAPPVSVTYPTPSFPGVPMPPPAAAPMPMPWEVPGQPPTEAGIMGMGGMGTMAMIGGGALLLVVLMGQQGGGRRR